MVELRYRNAFKEVDEILKYTDIDLVNKIPKKFINFLRANMNNDYEFNVQEGLHLNKQNLSEEANNILALIYRDYWATEEEKEEFRKKDEEERKLNEEKLEQKKTDVHEYHIDTFVIGDDWKGKFDFLKDEGCEVVYLPRTPEISTTQIKKDLNDKK